jgi:hypothetical protein
MPYAVPKTGEAPHLGFFIDDSSVSHYQKLRGPGMRAKSKGVSNGDYLVVVGSIRLASIFDDDRESEVGHRERTVALRRQAIEKEYHDRAIGDGAGEVRIVFAREVFLLCSWLDFDTWLRSFHAEGRDRWELGLDEAADQPMEPVDVGNASASRG